MTDPRKSQSPNADMVIEVTADDIKLAKPKDSGHCMIADALGRQRPDTRHRSVDLATIRWSDPRLGKRYVALTPPVAQRALLDFDHGRRVAPFTFRIRPVQVVAIRKPGVRPEKPTIQKSISTGGVPTVIGGRTPPRGALAGGSGSGSRKATAPPAAAVHEVTAPKAAEPVREPVREPVAPITPGATKKARDDIRTGRTRSYGLRAMGQ